MPPVDPRHIVTPDAFRVHEPLLGAPLASPKRRLAALLLDLLLASIAGSLGGVLIGGVVAVAFFRLATRRRGGHPLKQWARAGLALAGALVLFVTAVAVLDRDDDADLDFAQAMETAEARREVGEALQEVGIDDPETAAGLFSSAFLPDDVRRTLEASMAAAATGPDSVSVPDAEAVAALLHRYAASVAAADTAALDTLTAPAAEAVAGPELARLRARNERLGERAEALDDENERLEAAAANPGIGRLLRATLQDFGLTVGWVGLYFTLFLAWWGGRTPGKRLLGMRVVRLDGEPITLWNAFERFGGLAAGVATGLLGFAQVYWDANRQGIHDKIASTVVLRTGGRTDDGAQPTA